MAAGEQLPPPDAVCDGGDLDCGSGLLLIIRSAMAKLGSGGHLLVKSRERSVREDLPAWCRMVGHDLLAETAADGGYTHYLLRKKRDDDALAQDLRTAREHVWQTRVRKSGAMRASAAMRNHALTIGQPASFDVQDEAPSALELLLAAVGGALNTGLQWRLSQRGIEAPNLEVVVKGRLDNALYVLGVDDRGSPALAGLDVAVYTDADCGDDQLRAVLAETVERCPVTRSLTRGVAVHTTIRSV